MTFLSLEGERPGWGGCGCTSRLQLSLFPLISTPRQSGTYPLYYKDLEGEEATQSPPKKSWRQKWRHKRALLPLLCELPRAKPLGTTLLVTMVASEVHTATSNYCHVLLETLNCIPSCNIPVGCNQVFSFSSSCGTFGHVFFPPLPQEVGRYNFLHTQTPESTQTQIIMPTFFSTA